MHTDRWQWEVGVGVKGGWVGVVMAAALVLEAQIPCKLVWPHY